VLLFRWREEIHADDVDSEFSKHRGIGSVKSVYILEFFVLLIWKSSGWFQDMADAYAWDICHTFNEV
jgi:hypothetical protein